MSHVDWVPASSPSSPPPAETLHWVETQLECRVLSCEPLVGGLSSAVHRLQFAERDPVALRRFTLSDWLEREPEIPGDEARNLTMLGELDLGVSTPTLIAADTSGASCDVPSILMTEVAGRPIIDPADPLGWAERLAACLARMHEHPPVVDLPRYRRWDDPDWPVPTWTAEPTLWTEAKQRSRSALPVHPDAFLHRDYHPNNIHWDADGEICAVVDWLSACTGPVAGDLAHCRWNLAILDEPATAEHFTKHYRSITGYSEDTRAFDLSVVLSGPVGPFPTHAWNALGRTDLTSDSVGPKIDSWLALIMS